MENKPQNKAELNGFLELMTRETCKKSEDILSRIAGLNKEEVTATVASFVPLIDAMRGCVMINGIKDFSSEVYLQSNKRRWQELTAKATHSMDDMFSGETTDTFTKLRDAILEAKSFNFTKREDDESAPKVGELLQGIDQGVKSFLDLAEGDLSRDMSDARVMFASLPQETHNPKNPFDEYNPLAPHGGKGYRSVREFLEATNAWQNAALSENQGGSGMHCHIGGPRRTYSSWPVMYGTGVPGSTVTLYADREVTHIGPRPDLGSNTRGLVKDGEEAFVIAQAVVGPNGTWEAQVRVGIVPGHSVDMVAFARTADGRTGVSNPHRVTVLKPDSMEEGIAVENNIALRKGRSLDADSKFEHEQKRMVSAKADLRVLR